MYDEEEVKISAENKPGDETMGLFVCVTGKFRMDDDTLRTSHQGLVLSYT